MSYCKWREAVPAGLLVTFTSCCLSLPHVLTSWFSWRFAAQLSKWKCVNCWGADPWEKECVRVCTSQLRTRALTKKWPFQADDKWLAGFIDAFTLRCGFSDKIIDSGQVTSRGISWASVTNYNVFTKKTVASLSRARRTLNKQRVKRRQREGVWVGANAERGSTDLTKKIIIP